MPNGLTWDAQRSTFRALAAETNSGPELYAVLRRMIGSLNDPHTRVFSPEERFDWWRPRFVTIGLAVKEVGGLPTVVQVERGSAPQRAGIAPGDVIEAVNDQPALSLIQRRLSDRIATGLPHALAPSPRSSTDLPKVSSNFAGKGETERLSRPIQALLATART